MIRMTLNDMGRLTDEQIKDAMILDPLIKENINYYDGENPRIIKDVREKELKGANPNNMISSPYFSTIVDGLSGFCAGEIKYLDKTKDKKDAADMLEGLSEIMYYNAADVLNANIFTQQVGIGVAYEYHYFDKGIGNKYMFTDLDPLCSYPVFDYSKTSKLIAFIYASETSDKDVKKIRVDYSDGSDEYEYKDSKLKKINIDTIPNDYAPDIPVIVYYNSFKKGLIVSVCQKVKSYIDAMDSALTGNWNDLVKYATAILLHMSEIDRKDIDDMAEKRAWQIPDKEELDAIRYLTKEIQVEWQKFFIDLIKMEIHKHTHVIDFQNPDTGIGNAESGKALLYRMTDMASAAVKYERLNREGQYKRIKLLQNVNALPDGKENMIEIEYNHNIPEDFYETLTALNQDAILSTKTKLEYLKLDPEIEMKRKEDEKKDTAEGILNSIPKIPINGNPDTDNQDDENMDNVDNAN